MTVYTEEQIAQVRSHLKAALAVLDGAAIREDAEKVEDWRKLAPTEKQVKILKEHGYDVNITRGQASEIITKIFKEERRH